MSSRPAGPGSTPPSPASPRTATAAARPAGYSLLAALVTEVVPTAIFLFIILGATDTRAPRGFAPIAIGLSLTLIHLVSIPVTNTSVNPARSIGPALFAGGGSLGQLWLFIAAPVVGGLIGGFTYAALLGQNEPASSLEQATAA
jgi:aquaporin Z